MPTSHYQYDQFELASSLACLLSNCSALMSELIGKRANSCRLSFNQRLVILRLHETGIASATELGRHLRLDPAVVTRLVEALETGGYVHRERRVSDRRAVDISLTQRGEQQIGLSKRLIVDSLNLLLDPFSSTEVETITVQLNRLQDRLKRYL